MTEALRRTWEDPPGLLGALASVDHKRIATRYIVTAFVFLALGGLLALLIRWQLARPEARLLGPDRYNQVFTMRGTNMMFLFAVPVMEAILVAVSAPDSAGGTQRRSLRPDPGRLRTAGSPPGLCRGRADYRVGPPFRERCA